MSHALGSGARSACDDAASGDLAKLSVAYQKWRAEFSQMNCDASAVTTNYWTDTSGDHPNTRIASLVGPYYQWTGTTGACDVRVQYNQDASAFQAGAVLGNRPLGWNDARRWIFQLTATGGIQVLPQNQAVDVSTWNSFSPGVVTPNDTTSLLNGGCPQ